MPELPRDRFLEKLSASWRDGGFVKFTLSRYRGAESGLKNVYGRAIEVRGEPHVSLVWRYATRDVTKNFPLAQASEVIGKMLGSEFVRAHLFTTAGDWQLVCDATGAGRLKASRPAFSVAPAPEHDRRKQLPLAGREPFLQALGVIGPSGEPRPGMADKLRQIQRFVEILGHLVDASPLAQQREVRVLDMGAGKGYLTFATAEFFRQRGVSAQIAGVEARAELVELTNRVARETGFEQLHFEQGTIADFSGSGGAADLLIALHACDTATDDALHHGVRAGAALILTAPCCHQEIRAQLIAPPVLREVLRHGILVEREAEIVTDAIRALLLEIHGYKASVFEFISPEHTGKNLMIAAQKRDQPSPAEPLRKRLRELLDFYGIRSQRLAELFGESKLGEELTTGSTGDTGLELSSSSPCFPVLPVLPVVKNS